MLLLFTKLFAQLKKRVLLVIEALLIWELAEWSSWKVRVHSTLEWSEWRAHWWHSHWMHVMHWMHWRAIIDIAHWHLRSMM